MHFTDDLIAAMAKKKSRLCVGIDPNPERLPGVLKESFPPDLKGVIQAVSHFSDLVIEAVAPHAVAVKPQLAYFELLGPEGFILLQKVVKRAREAGLFVILDGKRNDIGSTARAYARAYLGTTQDFKGGHHHLYLAQALTVNPYFGSDGLTPFFDEARRWGKGIFILVKTSNPSSAQLQDLTLSNGETLALTLARKVRSWGEGYLGDTGYSLIGAVVGVQAHSVLLPLRELMPRTLFLVPGLGTQGGCFADLTGIFNDDGYGALVNVSRSILYAFEEGALLKDVQESIAEKALYYKEGLQALHEGGI